MSPMIEGIFFVLGMGFSLLVYVRSIRTTAYSPLHKALYFVVSTIGITGTLFLFGVLIADRLRNFG